MSKYVSLSYTLSPDLSCYNNQYNIRVMPYKDHEKEVRFIGHVGTHVDVPYHVFEKGKKITDYNIEDFIYKKVGVALVNPTSCYVMPHDLSAIPRDADFIIISTGSSKHRRDEAYALRNIGISREVALYLRNEFPYLRAIGIDSISINAYEEKQSGRDAHKVFLGGEREILVVEDMDLSQLGIAKIKELIVAPLIIANGDGAPCQVIARLNAT